MRVPCVCRVGESAEQPKPLTVVIDPGLQAVTGDEFAQQLLADQPDGMDAVVDALVAKRTRRQVTRSELVDQLAGSFPDFAAKLRLRAV